MENKKFGILALSFGFFSIPLFILSLILFNTTGLVFLILGIFFLVFSMIFGYLFLNNVYKDITKNQTKKTKINISYIRIPIIISVLLLILFSFIFDYFIYPILIESLQPNPYRLLYSNSLFGIFWGIFFCGAYARFYKKLPGEKATNKGIFLGLIFWLVGPITLRIVAVFLLGILTYYHLNYITIAIFSIFSLFYWLLIGFIVGKVWKKYTLNSTDLSE